MKMKNRVRNKLIIFLKIAHWRKKNCNKSQIENIICHAKMIRMKTYLKIKKINLNHLNKTILTIHMNYRKTFYIWGNKLGNWVLTCLIWFRLICRMLIRIRTLFIMMIIRLEFIGIKLNLQIYHLTILKKILTQWYLS
jgi:hypothetical protein